jgi:hypothetical protein
VTAEVARLPATLPPTGHPGPRERRPEIETATIGELRIEDVDPTESDDELWDWMLAEVFLPSGIEVIPWTRQSLRRDPMTGSATVSLGIQLRQGDQRRPAVN